MTVPTDSPSAILAIDQGTSGTTVLLIDQQGHVIGRGYREITCHYPRPGWVEQDAEHLWQQTLRAIADACASASATAPHIVAIGIANQRETAILWDARTGAPVGPAIVWQCRRSAPLCDELRAQGLEADVSARTGLFIDPYFSATKIRWVLDQDSEVRRRAENGDVRFGTVDSWLIWKLTGGRVHRTDETNASRTMLFNIYDCSWDAHILDLLQIPAAILPEVKPSLTVFAESDAIPLPNGLALPAGVPISGVAGDQQAALFGQACFEPGTVKCTYGTGAFLLMNTGPIPVRSHAGLVTTLTCGASSPTYALEGSIFVAGAAVQWLRDELGIIRTAAETEELAQTLPDNAGVYLVPAFVGLGAPYWAASARGAIIGLTRGTGKHHLARAALEAIAYQTRDVVEAMTADAKESVQELRIDGGAATNNFLAQFQADILGLPVARPAIVETTALGAAYLAGLTVGVWPSVDDISRLWRVDQRFAATMAADTRENLYRGWKSAISRVLLDDAIPANGTPSA